MTIENILTNIISWLSQYIEITSLIAPTISGENGVMALAFLSASGSFSVLKVIFFSFIGMLIIDSFWFCLIRMPIFTKIKNAKLFSEKYKRLEKKVELMSGKNDILILLISKILIGTRILVLIYISLRRFSYKKFITYDILPTFIWAIMLCSLGWFAGRGYYSLSKITSNLFFLSLFITLAIVTVYLILLGVRKWILKEK